MQELHLSSLLHYFIVLLLGGLRDLKLVWNKPRSLMLIDLLHSLEGRLQLTNNQVFLAWI